jgi:hypothetical protein
LQVVNEALRVCNAALQAVNEALSRQIEEGLQSDRRFTKKRHKKSSRAF